ncbi:MAG: helix-turn-helix domain-containing protein [Patescibacteria group bacterium]|nr:helix-turn-helix domain-containing protein [Patescibacteria group bacterium]
MTLSKNDKLLKISEAAEMLGVHPETLRRWDREGKIDTITINERGDRRFKVDEINRLIKKNN